MQPVLKRGSYWKLHYRLLLFYVDSILSPKDQIKASHRNACCQSSQSFSWEVFDFTLWNVRFLWFVTPSLTRVTQFLVSAWGNHQVPKQLPKWQHPQHQRPEPVLHAVSSPVHTSCPPPRRPCHLLSLCSSASLFHFLLFQSLPLKILSRMKFLFVSVYTSLLRLNALLWYNS